MDEKTGRRLQRSSMVAVFISGCALLALTISLPILCSLMNQLEEDIAIARKKYDDVSNFMWKDLREQERHLRSPRQAYKESEANFRNSGSSGEQSSYKAGKGNGGEEGGQPGEGGGEGGDHSEGGGGDGKEEESLPGEGEEGIRPEGGGGGPQGGSRAACTAESCISQSCPAGPPGPKGAAGQPGEPGNDGVPGKAGEAAGQSDTGGQYNEGCPPCPSGPPGVPGYRGKKGPRGPKGTPGAAGPPGRDGEMGDEGPEGDIGRQGKQGEAGARGAPGEPGMAFAKGARGESGPMGPPGPEGEEGLPGERGEDASPGQMGPPGPQGPPGEPGSEGIPGTPGKGGSTGENAEYCPCPPRKGETTGDVSSGGPEQYSTGKEVPSGAAAPEEEIPSSKGAGVESGEESYPEKGAGATGAVLTDKGGVYNAGRGGEGGNGYKERINKATFARQLRRKLVAL